MASIAEAAGVSRQAAYLHFHNRAGLLLAIVRFIDEREGIADRLSATSQLEPREALLESIRIWLDYLPSLHPAPGFLARAKHDPAARTAWLDRMRELEALYRAPLRHLHRKRQLRPGLSTEDAVATTRALASVHAWEHLVHDSGWDQKDAVDMLVRAVEGAVLR